MKDKDLGMKNCLTGPSKSVKALMNQGVGVMGVENPCGDVKALMNNGGKGPKSAYKHTGKRGVGPLMNQK